MTFNFSFIVRFLPFVGRGILDAPVILYCEITSP